MYDCFHLVVRKPHTWLKNGETLVFMYYGFIHELDLLQRFNYADGCNLKLDHQKYTMQHYLDPFLGKTIVEWPIAQF
jgi:hypothetical protein